VNAPTDEMRQRLAEFREAFDRSFAEPADREVVEHEDLLAIRVAGDPYAVRVDAIAGLVADPVVTALPGAPARLLGVVVVRRVVLPAYDLGAALGYARSASPRWLVVARCEPAVALAFEAVDGHVRLPRAAITGERATEDEGSNARGRALASDVVHVATGVRAVIDIPAVHATLVAGARSGHHG
jgi:purine-binding chemotaxis protein CheW